MFYRKSGVIRPLLPRQGRNQKAPLAAWRPENGLVAVPLMEAKGFEECLGLVAEVLKKRNGQKSGKHDL